MHYVGIDCTSVAVERWTPRGESTRPGWNGPGLLRRDGRLMLMSLLAGVVTVGGMPWQALKY